MLLFSFAPDVDQEARDRVLQGLRGLPDAFPAIDDFEVGPNESRRDETYDYGMTMTFSNSDALESYLNSEIHEAFVRTQFRPFIVKRAIVSFQVGDQRSAGSK